MTDELRYLEKYSVAPAPSRDYYGIRILHNEVKLYLWKISHGPHRTPIVRSTNFSDFERDGSLHEEILRVFGKSVLQYVKDTIAGKTNNSEENSWGLTKGWNRVLKEGKLMQQVGKCSTSFEKKRCVRGVGRISPTRVKGFHGSSKVRGKILSKTPLEVIKKMSGLKRSTDKSPERLKTSTIHNYKAPANLKQITEVSEKILSMKVTKLVEKSNNSTRMMTTSSTINDNKEKETRTTNKSTILKTGDKLINGLSIVEKKNVQLADLIQQEAKKNHIRSSTDLDPYLNCLEDIEKSCDSWPDKYTIENPWSSNSSINSVDSHKIITTDKNAYKNERSLLTKKNESARQSSTNKSSFKAKKGEKQHPRAKSVETKARTSTNIGTSTSRTVNIIKRSGTNDKRIDDIRSSSFKNVNFKNHLVSTKKDKPESKMRNSEK